MKKVYSKIVGISALVLVFNSCTKETITREAYNPSIGIYGVWRVVDQNQSYIKDYAYLHFNNKKTLNVYIKDPIGFRSSFSSNFAPNTDQVIVDLYNYSQSTVFNYSFKGDTLVLESGGIIIAKSVKAAESEIMGWAEDVSAIDQISGVYSDNQYGIGFDGTNILMSDYNNNQIIKLNLSTRLPAGTITVDNSYPTTVEYDGSDLWVSSNGYEIINKHPIAGGYSTDDISVGAWVYGIAFDPASTNILAYSNGNDTLYTCNRNTNSVISTKYLGSGFYDLAWSNGKLFITRGAYIYRINMSGFVIEKTYKIKNANNIAGIAAVGNDFWLNVDANKLIKVTLN